jgi:hypothetical protein
MEGPVHILRSRRLIALLSFVLALGVAACDGGDAIPDAPAEDAGGAAPDPGGEDTGTGTLGGNGAEPPPEGANQPIPDPGDDLDQPTD